MAERVNGRLDDLDGAFELPDEINDPKLRNLYEVLVHRMRNEAKHLPMNTVQQLLIERIAYNYIVLRAKEAGKMGGFSTAVAQKDYNTFWLSMTAEFNRLLTKAETMNSADRKSLLREVQTIIVSTVADVVDPHTRSDLLDKFATAFQDAGI